MPKSTTQSTPKSMTKTEMVKKLAGEWDSATNRQADETLTAFITFLTKTVKKDKVLKVPNLGTFRLRQLKARTGRNPQTGEPIRIKARKKVAFTPSKAFKEGILGAPRTAAKKTASSRATATKKTASSRATAARKTTSGRSRATQ